MRVKLQDLLKQYSSILQLLEITTYYPSKKYSIKNKKTSFAFGKDKLMNKELEKIFLQPTHTLINDLQYQQRVK